MILQCGHAPNSTNGAGIPSCAICVGIHPEPNGPVEQQPSLKGRMARCGCGSTCPSDSEALAFFEFRGAGSRVAKTSCGNCGYDEVTHSPAGMARNVVSNRKTVVEQGKCRGFQPHGPYELDGFYCGHSGWD